MQLFLHHGHSWTNPLNVMHKIMLMDFDDLDNLQNK